MATNTAILGLGDLVLQDRERIQPRAGCLNLLLQDRDSGKRYEVELQLGPTDEAHIIRTVVYLRFSSADTTEELGKTGAGSAATCSTLIKLEGF